MAKAKNFMQLSRGCACRSLRYLKSYLICDSTHINPNACFFTQSAKKKFFGILRKFTEFCEKLAASNLPKCIHKLKVYLAISDTSEWFERLLMDKLFAIQRKIVSIKMNLLGINISLHTKHIQRRKTEGFVGWKCSLKEFLKVQFKLLEL